MRTFSCTCESQLFFENTHCLSCNRTVGYCTACAQMTPFDASAEGATCEKCQTPVVMCGNYANHDICNRLVPQGGDGLCDYCQLTRTIPDLNVPENLRRWYDLEAAKRRTLQTLERIGLPIHGTDPALAFDFKGDVVVKDALWRTVGTARKVFTGHANGLITINIKEADDEVREKLRVDLQESQRTLVGHFHHEIGHFYWELFAKGSWLTRFVELFGDHENPSYGDALELYYENGPKPNWAENHVSAYATMHPWEDFAETWASYLDMVAVVDTAQSMRPRGGHIDVATADMPTMFREYTETGVFVNEMNRTLGLLDFQPHVFTPKVVEKLQFIHDMVRAHAQAPAVTAAA